MNVRILEDSCLDIALAWFSQIRVAKVEPGKVCSIRCQAGCYEWSERFVLSGSWRLLTSGRRQISPAASSANRSNRCDLSSCFGSPQPPDRLHLVCSSRARDRFTTVTFSSQVRWLTRTLRCRCKVCCPSVAVGAPDLQGLSDLSSGSEPALGFRLRRLEIQKSFF